MRLEINESPSTDHPFNFFSSWGRSYKTNRKTSFVDWEIDRYTENVKYCTLIAACAGTILALTASNQVTGIYDVWMGGLQTGGAHRMTFHSSNFSWEIFFASLVGTPASVFTGYTLLHFIPRLFSKIKTATYNYLILPIYTFFIHKKENISKDHNPT